LRSDGSCAKARDAAPPIHHWRVNWAGKQAIGQRRNAVLGSTLENGRTKDFLAQTLTRSHFISGIIQYYQWVLDFNITLKIRFRKECRFDPDRPHQTWNSWGFQIVKVKLLPRKLSIGPAHPAHFRCPFRRAAQLSLLRRRGLWCVFGLCQPVPCPGTRPRRHKADLRQMVCRIKLTLGQLP